MPMPAGDIQLDAGARAWGLGLACSFVSRTARRVTGERVGEERRADEGVKGV